ncbi:ComF family protein [Kordiimonas pumila]|uniref:ComF family protein n=1 Tax=Kordiimonas pumila TaxID=2161677 RepID=A0ABV7D153_9PROT|nr:ComF family protein [Kordiimonas pumila]
MANVRHLLKRQNINSAVKALIAFALPHRCPECGVKVSEHGFLCVTCWGDVQVLAPPFCVRCALPFDYSTEIAEPVCAACLQYNPAFDWARAAVSYEGLGRSLVLKLKHGGTSMIVPVMARMMAGSVRQLQATLIIPVPLHRWRFLKRRFNQSQLLAERIAEYLDVPVNVFALKRRKATLSQASFSRKKRFKNVRGAFEVPPEMKAVVKGQHIMLVDDVLTTGATAASCAKALKKAGALSVGVVAFARVGDPAAP